MLPVYPLWFRRPGRTALPPPHKTGVNRYGPFAIAVPGFSFFIILAAAQGVREKGDAIEVRIAHQVQRRLVL
jgi:hypothetical protein